MTSHPRQQIQHLSSDEALRSLHTTSAGLTEPEAQRRSAEFGPNVLERIPTTPMFLRLLQQFIHFFALLLWAAAGLAFLAAWQDPGSGMAPLGLAILAVILINGVFSFWQEYKAEQALEALQKLLPQQVKLLRGGIGELRPASEVVPGDVFLLEEGALVPADCRVIETRGLRMNNATVTGESVPQARNAAPSPEEVLLEAKNIVLAGTTVASGQATVVAFATGMHTEFGTIAHLTQGVQKGLSPLQIHVTRLSRWIGGISVGLGLAFFAMGQALGLPLAANFMFAIGVIVANVPEGLLPTVTLALAMGAQRLARKQALVRHLPAVETLGSATVICTDKTGTLTQNRMEVRQVFNSSGAFPAEGLLLESLAGGPFRRLLEGAFYCHDLHAAREKGQTTWKGDPMEISLRSVAAKALPSLAELPKVDEIPFEGDRKRLSTIHRIDGGLRLYSKGAPELLLDLCDRVEMEGQIVPLGAETKARFLDNQRAMAERGLRVLAFAFKEVPESYDPAHLEEGMVLSGLAGLEDPPRPDVAKAMATCHAAGIRVIMITGDHPLTATAIGREIGMLRSDAPAVVTGEELRRMSEIQLQLKLDAPELLFARMGAEQKLRIVQALKRKGHVVAVTGDGVNDAPALREADIGIAMGLSGTDVAKEASDMVLLDDHFATIVNAIEEGRAVFENVQKFLTYHMSSNVAELAPYLIYVLFKLPLGLTVIQILMVDLGTDMVPALGLGAEKPGLRVMTHPPRRQTEALLTWGLAARTYLWLGAVEAFAGVSGFFHVLHQGGWVAGQALAWNDPLYLRGTTACLAGIILVQMMNVFVCRSPVDSAFSFRWTGNKLLLSGVALEAALLVFFSYSGLAHRLIGTGPLPWETWLFLLPFPLLLLFVEEARKAVARRLIH